MKTITLQEAYAKATGGQLYAGYGEGCCFHAGNKASICKTNNPESEEPTEETVAEVWPTTGDADRYDAALLAHAYNVLPEVVAALDLMRRHYDDLSKSNPGFMGKLCLQDYALWNEALIAMDAALAKANKVEVP